MTTETRLNKFDVENLDLFERQQFNSGIEIGLSKSESLQLIIDGTGDLNELSDELQEIAIEQNINA